MSDTHSALLSSAAHLLPAHPQNAVSHPTRVPLVPFARELAAECPDEVSLYPRLYKAVMNGRVPAVQVCGRWLVDRADKPQIKAVLGLPDARAAAPAASASVAA